MRGKLLLVLGLCWWSVSGISLPNTPPPQGGGGGGVFDNEMPLTLHQHSPSTCKITYRMCFLYDASCTRQSVVENPLGHRVKGSTREWPHNVWLERERFVCHKHVWKLSIFFIPGNGLTLWQIYLICIRRNDQSLQKKSKLLGKLIKLPRLPIRWF